MKIDLHTHTRKCKTGDEPTREVSASEFCEAVLATNVGIVAITNHNVFDLEQFTEIQSGLEGAVQVWPGIELDVLEGGSRGHLLVIVSPQNADKFSDVVKKVTDATTPDSFSIEIKDVINNFEILEPLYIAHYKQKKPDLSDNALDELMISVDPTRVIKEVTNSISAGIYISHGYASIYGSDVHDWSQYAADAGNLPDLRLPVESFEHFCLLLKKDATTINTALNKKVAEELTLTPFEDGTLIKIKAFNDINIIFGAKGTGKSCILTAIAKHYSDSGVEAEVYSSAVNSLDETFDTKGKNLSLNLQNYDINYCKDEIDLIRNASEVDITSISKYLSYFQIQTTNKNATKLKLKDVEPEEETRPKHEFNEFNNALGKAVEFSKFLNSDPAIKKVLSEDELVNLSDQVAQILTRLQNGKLKSLLDWKEISLLNTMIKKLRYEVERKTGAPAKPTTTGFRDYAFNRIRIAVNVEKIIKNFSTTIPVEKMPVGNIGANKGELELQTEFVFQNGTITDSTLQKLKGVKKGTQKLFSRKIRQVLGHAYNENLFQCINELNDIEDIEQIETVYELLLFKRFFVLNGNRYNPSSGEASMVMLHKELGSYKDVYILDEPERSLGNEYISEVIVPLIKEHARAGKKVFISTHDANIAVRTLPYSSIFRCHGTDGYKTYVGNPFSNNLINPEEIGDLKSWREVSMKTLEGGEEAFGERGKIYGNT